MSTIYGDPLLNPLLSGTQHGKDQTLVGIDNQDNLIIGDVATILGNATGGNDVLSGGSGNSSNPTDALQNDLYGGANDMSGSAQGGNDLLIAGSNSGAGTVRNTLFGDAGGSMSGN